MRYSTYQPLTTVQTTSTGVADTKTIVAPRGASMALITVETTDARVTFDGSTPATSNGLVFKKDVSPVEVRVGLACTITFNAATAAASIVNVAWLG